MISAAKFHKSHRRRLWVLLIGDSVVYHPPPPPTLIPSAPKPDRALVIDWLSVQFPIIIGLAFQLICV
jgi:hypothetical protein